MSHQIFDDVTLCKHVTTEEENVIIFFNSFSLIWKKIIMAETSDRPRVVILEINIVIAQIVIPIQCSLSCDELYACELGKICMMILKNIL